MLLQVASCGDRAEGGQLVPGEWLDPHRAILCRARAVLWRWALAPLDFEVSAISNQARVLFVWPLQPHKHQTLLRNQILCIPALFKMSWRNYMLTAQHGHASFGASFPAHGLYVLEQSQVFSGALHCEGEVLFSNGACVHPVGMSGLLTTSQSSTRCSWESSS